jgi:signal transduction histidine kinase
VTTRAIKLDPSLRERLLTPAATEALERAGLEITIELGGEGEDAERRIASTLAQLEPAQTVLARLQQLASLGELGAGLTHEVRNLLTGILGFSQLARQRNHAAAVGRSLDAIARETAKCIELLERFLDLARTGPRPSEVVDVHQLIGQVVDATRHQLSIAQIVLAVELGGVPQAWGRRDAIVQVLLNLVINAIHAMPAGGRLAITSSHDGDAIEIAVADTGHGIAPDLHERIFDAFFTTKPAGEGTGLGLAMCRRMLASFGGTIRVASEPGHGATFIVRVPAYRGAAA